MQITMNEMVALNQLLSEHKTDKMPIRVAYKFGKLMKSFSEDMDFFQGHYREILLKYCQKKEDGNLFIDENNNFIIEKENTEAYTKEMTELLNTPVELPNIRFTFDELDSLEMTVQEAGIFEKLIEE